MGQAYAGLSPMAKLLKKLSGNKLNNATAEVLAERPWVALKLRKAYKIGESYSKIICGIANDAPRPTNDEADAIRHYIGSSLLGAYVGVDYARRLLTANEDRPRSNSSKKMDILNNEYALSQVNSLPRRKVLSGNEVIPRYKYVIDDSLAAMTEFAEKALKSGKLKVLKSKVSDCQDRSLYPNLD